MSNKENIIKRLYHEYSFIEKDISKFEEIAFISGEENLLDAQENIYKYIANKINENGLIKVFDQATSTLRIKDVFDVFDSITKIYNIDISDSDIEALCNNPKYQNLYNKIIKDIDMDYINISNDLLKSVIEAKVIFSDEVNVENTKIDDCVDLSDDIVRDYLKYIGQFDVLSRKEEQELFERYKENNDEEAKDKIINCNLKLVVYVAIKYKPQNLRMGFMDYIQEGNMGLLKAFDKFDHTKEYKFSTYATWWIRQALQRSVDDNNTIIRIPVHMNENIRKYYKKKKEFEYKYNREPTKEEMMKALNLEDESDYKKIEAAIRISDPLSLDNTITDTDSKKDRETKFGDFVTNETMESVEDIVERGILHDQEEKVLSEILTEREAYIIKARFGFNGEKKTLEELGKKLGITRERVRQIESKAIKKLEAYGNQLKMDKSIKKITNGKEDEEMAKKTIYELVGIGYEKLNGIIDQELTEEEKKLIEKRNNEKLNQEENKKFFLIVRKLRNKIKQKINTKKHKTIYELIDADREAIDKIINTELTEEEKKIVRDKGITKLTKEETKKYYTIATKIRRKLNKKERKRRKIKTIYELIDADREAIDIIINTELTEEERNLIEKREKIVSKELDKELTEKEIKKFYSILTKIRRITKSKTESTANKTEEKEETIIEVPQTTNTFIDSYKQLLNISLKDPRVIQELDIMDISIACVRYGIGKSKVPRDIETISKFYKISKEEVESISTKVLEKLYNIIVEDINENNNKYFIKKNNENNQ